MKNSLGFPPLPRHDISAALQRLIRSFAQLFAPEREGEVEMEIGLPTGVQHVSHIGMDVKGIGTLNVCWPKHLMRLWLMDPLKRASRSLVLRHLYNFHVT